jgi:hypothetical protein
MRRSDDAKFSLHPFHEQGKSFDPDGEGALVVVGDIGQDDIVGLAVIGDDGESEVDGVGIGR